MIGLFKKNKKRKNIKNKTNTIKNYVDLAPSNDIENGDEYLSVLDWAIHNERIKNIALTGPYGSGKSSIIETYKCKHPLLKSLSISLATFTDKQLDENGNEKIIPVSPEDIERGILKQLFYKVDYRKIPQSRYRKLHKISIWDVYCSILLIVAVVCIFVHIFNPGTLCDLINKIKDANLLPFASAEAGVVAFSVLCLLLLAIISEICRTLLSKVRIKDINVADKATVETNENEPESIFNKNIDEIIYFFEETKYKVVFFEDLDRLKNPAVFVHLRELNNLLNESEVIRRRIVFIYALKDDIFIEKDRTKFFDLIIPVIPYINSTNSGDSLNKMLERAKELGDTHDISPNYVLDVSPFIDDMRLLLNIYNEFLVYKRTLQTGQGLEGLHDEPMMSLIIFKNLYPKDFSDLQMEAGIVKRVFEAKAKFIGKKRDEIHEEIQVLTDKLENIPVDTLNSRNELISSFASSITNWQGIAYKLTTINPGGYSYYISEFLNTEYDFNTVKVTPSCSVSYRSWDNMDY